MQIHTLSTRNPNKEKAGRDETSANFFVELCECRYVSCNTALFNCGLFTVARTQQKMARR
jgi:hypothetical protein